jgi:hypothetical protein
MFGFVGESADRVFNVGRGEGFEGCFVASGEEFRESRAGGDGSGAAADFESSVGDASGFDKGGEPEDVAADGIGNFEDDGWRGKFADVARIAKVIEKLGGH